MNHEEYKLTARRLMVSNEGLKSMLNQTEDTILAVGSRIITDLLDENETLKLQLAAERISNGKR